MKNTFSAKALRLGGYSLILCAIVLAAVVLLNVIFGLLPSSVTTVDLTSSDLSAVGDVTKEYLKGLTQEVVLYQIVSPGKEDAITTKLLRSYTENSPKVKLKTVDPTMNPTFLSQYGADTVSENSVIVVNPASPENTPRYRVIEYDDMFTYYIVELDKYMNYSDAESYYQFSVTYYSKVPTIEQYFQGEGLLTSAIDYVSSEGLPVIYELTGHGEKTISQDVKNMLLQDNITVIDDFSLVIDGVIPEDASLIVIDQPTSDISAFEKGVLLDFLKSDGNILVLTAYESGNIDEKFPNLLSLCQEMGLTAERGFVVDNQSGYYTIYQGKYFALLPQPGTTSGPFRFFDATGQTFLMLSSHP
ncbi:MAG: Gldg family protein, partial [Clostridia bacterium]|nr:Gldg family protein [Clostridia bacterium]